MLQSRRRRNDLGWGLCRRWWLRVGCSCVLNDIVPRRRGDRLRRQRRALPHRRLDARAPQRVALLFGPDRRAAQRGEEQRRAGGIRQ